MNKKLIFCLVSFLFFLPEIAFSYRDDCVGFCHKPDYTKPNIYKGKSIQFMQGSKQHYTKELWRDAVLGRNFSDAIREPHKIVCADVLYHAGSEPPLKRQIELFVGYDRAMPRGIGVFTVQDFQRPEREINKAGYQSFYKRQHNGERYYEFRCELKMAKSKTHYNSDMKVWDYYCFDRYGDVFFTLKQLNLQDKTNVDQVDLNKLEAVIELPYPFNGHAYNDGQHSPHFFEECSMEIWALEDIVETYKHYLQVKN